MFNKIFLVGAGGLIGSVFRYLCALGVSRLWPLANFPYGTLVVNVTGCFMIGFLGGLGASRQLFTESGRLFLFTGILGGFTTFSALGLETFYLIRASEWVLVFGNIFLQLVLGISAVAFGHWLSQIFQ